MQNLTIIEILKQVFTSWQVIAVTIAIIFYLFLISNAAKSYRRPRSVKKINVFNKKPKPAAAEGPETTASAANTNDELGLEEAD